MPFGPELDPGKTPSWASGLSPLGEGALGQGGGDGKGEGVAKSVVSVVGPLASVLSLGQAGSWATPAWSAAWTPQSAHFLPSAPSLALAPCVPVPPLHWPSALSPCRCE